MQKDAIITELKEIVPEHTQVGVIVRKTLAQNRKRVLSFLVFTMNKEKIEVRLLDHKMSQLFDDILRRVDNGVLIEGTGMDMGWYLVNKLGKTLYGYDGALEVLDL